MGLGWGDVLSLRTTRNENLLLLTSFMSLSPRRFSRDVSCDCFILFYLFIYLFIYLFFIYLFIYFFFY